MIVSLNRCQGRAADDGGMFTRATVTTDLVLLARLRAQVCEFSTIPVEDHVAMVAAVVTRAKRDPSNAYARATA